MVIVIAVLAILAAIVIPRYASAQDEARNAAAATNRKMVQNMVVSYQSQHGEYPTTIDPAWFAEKEIPPHPYAPDWAEALVQVTTDASSWLPSTKRLTEGVERGRPYWYNSGSGRVILRVPRGLSREESVALFNEFNGASITVLGQTTP